jgi:hypothetical protein
MKKLLLSIIALAAFVTLQAQWVNDPVNNNYLANTSPDAGELYISTDPISGDTYFQWCSFVGGNGWSPTLQRVNFAGEPQWDADGIHISGQQFPSWSQGFAMAATTDGGVVSCFAAQVGEDNQSFAVRINADGTFPWGEAGVLLFDGFGNSRTELMAGEDGGVWALGTDLSFSYLQYINADGTLNPLITISDTQASCTFGKLLPAANNGVFVVYEKENWAYSYYYTKSIWVKGYNVDGSVLSQDEQLMADQTVGGSYVHYVVPDGLGGGYVYIWHSAFGEAFNTYVFHFNENGANTFSDPNGTPVHSIDSYNFYTGAYGTVDPVSHDLIISFEQTDAAYQTESKIYVNRITTTGERLWNEGRLVYDSGTIPSGGARVNAFEYGGGFSVIYHRGIAANSSASSVEAQGYDMNFTPLWTTTMCSNVYDKTGDKNTSGYHGGQNIIAWIDATGSVTGGPGGLYGQNIGQNGEMGTVTPPTPPTPCEAPTSLKGEYIYDVQTMEYGVLISWNAPADQPLHYHLYRQDAKEVIEIDGTETQYFDAPGLGDFIYRLTAVHEDCESGYALTPTGDDYVFISVTSVPEVTSEEIVTIKAIYNLAGQKLGSVDLDELSSGIYIVHGINSDGNTIVKKIVK